MLAEKPDQQPEGMPAVEEFRRRLEMVMKRVVLWKEKGFKKVPAATAIADIEFMTLVIMTMTEANRELKEELDAARGPQPGQLVGLDGRTLGKDEPTIVIATN